MLKKLIFLITLIVFTTSSLALSLDFNESKVGREKQLAGNVILQQGTYTKDSLIKVSIDSVSKEKQIQELINCTTGCEEKSSEFYIYTGATATEISSSNFLTGIRLAKGSTISIAAKLNISNADANYPDTPTIDVGNDGIIEWMFQGKAPASIDWTVNQDSGPEINSADSTELNLDSIGTCQQVFLNKSNTFKISSTLRKAGTNPPSLGVYIQGKETSIIEPCTNLQNTFSSVECTISISNPLESGDYKICLTAPSAGIVLAANDSAANSQGYRCTSSSCNKVSNTDYAIKAKASNFITTLQDSLEYFESNTNPGAYFKDAIATYLQTCTYQDDFCVIPINVTTKNENNVRIHDLSYTETLADGQSYNRNKFLLGVKSEGQKSHYRLTSQATISISKFEILAPEDLGNYTLKVEYGLETATANIQVVPAPTANFNVSQQFAPTISPITFDASASKSDSALTYNWDFGDNASATTKTPQHSYLLPGNYLVKLIVTDDKSISDEKTLQIEIYSEKAENELIQDAISRLQSVRDKLSLPATKDIFEALALGKKIDDSISALSASTLTEQEVNDILNSVPTSITAVNKVTITPYLSVEQTNNLYGFETESYKATLQELNSRIQKEVTATLVSLSYPEKQERFVLVTKTITTPQEITDATVIELVPNSIAPPQDKIEFTDSLPEITRLEDYQSAKFSIPVLKDSFTFSYKLSSNDLNSIKDTVLIVIPKDLSPSLIPFNCGDGICNPAEDAISCPEDCTEEAISGFPWVAYIITIIVVLGMGFVVYKFKIYKKLNIDKFVETLSSRFRKSPFKSGVELAKVRLYIRSALEKGYDEERITNSLMERGWSREQIDYAFKKLNNKKQ